MLIEQLTEAAYDRGHKAGRAEGFDLSVGVCQENYQQGLKDGKKISREEARVHFVEHDEERYLAGVEVGKRAGDKCSYDEGHEAGFRKGVKHKKKNHTEHECSRKARLYQKGYAAALAAMNTIKKYQYDQGFQAGQQSERRKKVAASQDHPAYTLGFSAGRTCGYTQGRMHGDTKEYEKGYDKARDLRFCQAKKEGFVDGWNSARAELTNMVGKIVGKIQLDDSDIVPNYFRS